MEVLADKVHKQEEHIPEHCYISHNHPYINSRVLILCHCFLCRDGCVKCSNVVEYVLSLFVLSAKVPPSSHPYI